jgi:hypothetical protein
VAKGGEQLLDVQRLAAIRQVLEEFQLARQHSPRCVTAGGVDTARSDALAEIRTIADESWRPPLDGIWRRPLSEAS